MHHIYTKGKHQKTPGQKTWARNHMSKKHENTVNVVNEERSIN